MKQAQYKKTWLITSIVARDIIKMHPGSRLPTIQDYTERLHSSRGLVQNALSVLQEKNAITLEKRGAMGTFITSMDPVALFRLGNLDLITGSMPAPLSYYYAGLATGICQAMEACPVPFNFAFVQGAETRVNALRRGIYDFIILSLASARHHSALYPELTIAATLDGCRYAPPYTLYINRPGVKDISDGFSIAVDPNSTDQWQLTGRLCAGKDVRIVAHPYVATRAAFLAGEVDCVVWRDEGFEEGYPHITKVPIELADTTLECPVILTNINNHSIKDILLLYLNASSIAKTQNDVLEKRMEPAFF